MQELLHLDVHVEALFYDVHFNQWCSNDVHFYNDVHLYQRCFEGCALIRIIMCILCTYIRGVVNDVH